MCQAAVSRVAIAVQKQYHRADDRPSVYGRCQVSEPRRSSCLPKYVVSSTLVDPDWSNSTVLKGDAFAEVSKLKQKLNGDIVVCRQPRWRDRHSGRQGYRSRQRGPR